MNRETASIERIGNPATRRTGSDRGARGLWVLIPTVRDWQPPLLGRNLCCGAVLAVILWVGWDRAWRPLDRQLAHIHSRIHSLKTLSVRGSDILARRAEAQRWLAERESKTDALEQVPEQLQLAEFHDEISQLARASGVLIESCQAGEPTEREGLTTATISVRAEGDYAALCSFLERLQAGPRLCPVSSLAVTKPEIVARLLEFDLTVRIFAAPWLAQTEGARRD